MYTDCEIQISIQYLARFNEVLSDDVDGAELAIEEGIHPLLMELFGGGGMITIKGVTVRFARSTSSCGDDVVHSA